MDRSKITKLSRLEKIVKLSKKMSDFLFNIHNRHRKQDIHSRARKSNNPFSNYTYLQSNHNIREPHLTTKNFALTLCLFLLNILHPALSVVDCYFRW